MREPHKRKRRRDPSALPKGTYRLPHGGYAAAGSVRYDVYGHDIAVTFDYADHPNVKLLARALIQLAKRNLAKKRNHK